MKLFKKEIDMGWGNPNFLSELLHNEITKYGCEDQNYHRLDNMNYAPSEGMSELIEKTHNIVYKLTNRRYKYIMITNGATNAINIIFRTWKYRHGSDYVFTNKLGFPFYDQMIRKSDLWRIKDIKKPKKSNHITLVDSPGNPTGKQIENNGSNLTIWDSVYHSEIYNADLKKIPEHEVMVGSYGKLLGITGVKIGWIATDNCQDYQDFLTESLNESCTISVPSQRLVLAILELLDFNSFMKHGKDSLNRNRKYMKKLESILKSKVPKVGMFYPIKADEKIFKLFDKAKVKYSIMEDGEDKILRLNIGQTYENVKETVDRILKLKGAKND
jgi:aspartate/methionine/tyrosine aminotransferase